MNCSAAVHLLLERGASINEINDAGETALHKSIEFEFEDVAALLVKFEVDMSVRNNEGKTALQLLQNRPSSEGIARNIIREAVKRETLGQPICEEYRQMVQFYEEYSKFDQECRDEVERMRSKRIDEEDHVV